MSHIYPILLLFCAFLFYLVSQNPFTSFIHTMEQSNTHVRHRSCCVVLIDSITRSFISVRFLAFQMVKISQTRYKIQYIRFDQIYLSKWVRYSIILILLIKLFIFSTTNYMSTCDTMRCCSISLSNFEMKWVDRRAYIGVESNVFVFIYLHRLTLGQRPIGIMIKSQTSTDHCQQNDDQHENKAKVPFTSFDCIVIVIIIIMLVFIIDDKTIFLSNIHNGILLPYG